MSAIISWSIVSLWEIVMSKDKPKSTNALMKYLRDEKGMSIQGSSQKRKLKNIGYYHGYKGYRYIRKPSNKIAYTEFDELLAIYEFDSQIKSLLYPSVMFIETALKNYVLEVIVGMTGSESFVDIYSNLLDNYKMFSTAGKSYSDDKKRERAENTFKQNLNKRLSLRARVYKIQADAYNNGNKIANHYLSKDVSIPIWGIFELFSLGEFGHFVSCLNKRCRSEISKSLSIRQTDDNNAMIPQRLIYATKDLRNSIAHNDVVFDARFRTGNIDKQLRNSITNATGVQNLSFDTITDYIVLIVYQLKLLGVPKTDMKRLISDYTDSVERLRQNIPTSIFNQIIYTDNRQKINKLKGFIAS